VCADPPLTIDFAVELEGGGTEQIDNVRVANCSQDSGGGGVVDTGEDNSRTPEGGVDSGAGGREAKTAGPGVVSALIAGATVLGLVTAGLLARRRRGAR
jgi:hypothetical protein